MVRVSRKQVGMIDGALLDRVDAAREPLGQTRRLFVERALEAALRDDTPRPSPAGRQAKTEVAKTPARPAATARQGAARPVAQPRTPAAVKASLPPEAQRTFRDPNDLAMERQRKINEARERARRK